MNFLLHIGMPKCGSTFFQSICIGENEIYYQVKGYSYDGYAQDRIVQSLRTKPHPFLPDENNSGNLLSMYLEKARDSKLKLGVVSSESLQALDEAGKSKTRSIFEAMGIEPLVLLITRPYTSFMISMWKQDVLFGRTMMLDEYMKHPIDVDSVESSWKHAGFSVLRLNLEDGQDLYPLLSECLFAQSGIRISSEFAGKQINSSRFSLKAFHDYVMLANLPDPRIISRLKVASPLEEELPPFSMADQRARESILNEIQMALDKLYTIEELRRIEDDLLSRMVHT